MIRRFNIQSGGTSRYYFRSVLVCVFLAQLVPSIAFAQGSPIGYQAEGQIRYDVVLPLGGERHWTRDFKVTVEGCKWLIESFNKTDDQYSVQMREDKFIYSATRVNQSNNPALNDYAGTVEK